MITIRHQGAIGRRHSNIYRMATRIGAEDRWLVGVGLVPLRIPCHLCSSRWDLNRVAAGGSARLCSSGRWEWCQGLYRHIAEALSGGKWREGEVVPLSQRAAVMTSEPRPPNPTPFQPPALLLFTHILLPWQQWPFTPLPRLLHLLSIKWTGTFSPTHLYMCVCVYTHI